MLCFQRKRTQHILAFVVGRERPLSVLQKKVHKQLMLAAHVCKSFAETSAPPRLAKSGIPAGLNTSDPCLSVFGLLCQAS